MSASAFFGDLFVKSSFSAFDLFFLCNFFLKVAVGKPSWFFIAEEGRRVVKLLLSLKIRISFSFMALKTTEETIESNVSVCLIFFFRGKK